MRKSTGSFSKCLTEKHKLEIVGLATCWVSNKPARDRHFISWILDLTPCVSLFPPPFFFLMDKCCCSSTIYQFLPFFIYVFIFTSLPRTPLLCPKTFLFRRGHCSETPSLALSCGKHAIWKKLGPLRISWVHQNRCTHRGSGTCATSAVSCDPRYTSAGYIWNYVEAMMDVPVFIEHP